MFLKSLQRCACVALCFEQHEANIKLLFFTNLMAVLNLRKKASAGQKYKTVIAIKSKLMLPLGFFLNYSLLYFNTMQLVDIQKQLSRYFSRRWLNNESILAHCNLPNVHFKHVRAITALFFNMGTQQLLLWGGST